MLDRSMWPTRKQLGSDRPSHRLWRPRLTRVRCKWPVKVVTLGALAFLCMPAQARGPVSQTARELALAQNARASATGAAAVFVNPAGLVLRSEFSTAAQYRLDTKTRNHGLGVMIHDSLNNPRFALALTYAFMKGSPKVGFIEPTGAAQPLKLSHFGHEAALHAGVTVLPGWLSVGASIGYQYASLRYKDQQGQGQQMLEALNMVGVDVGTTLTLGRWARISAVGYNLVGSHPGNFSQPQPLDLAGINQMPASAVTAPSLSVLSDHPLSFAHAVAVYPLGREILSINTDGYYDFSSFKHQPGKYTRKVFGVGVEYIAGVIPIRAGARWDSMGKGKSDDEVWVSGGLAYTKPAAAGQPGFDMAFGLSQQVAGPAKKSTRIGITLAFRMRPQY